MKRKFILLSITLTALAPAISLVGCGDPDTPEPPKPEFIEVNEYHPFAFDEDLGYLQSEKISANSGDVLNFHISFSNWIASEEPFLVFISDEMPGGTNKSFQVVNFKIKDDSLFVDVDYNYNSYKQVRMICFNEDAPTRQFNKNDDWTLKIDVKEDFEDYYLFIFTGM